MTYSIVARDPDSGEFGVGVQSHWFSVGSLVPWAVPGVGAVATQATVEVAYGPQGLRAMQSGAGAQDALDELLSADECASVRQVAMVDAAGGTAVHTGADCIGYAGHATGAGVSCQANMMVSPEVWPAMLAAFETAPGPLAGRLLSALDAGEAAGGDARGRQSAALVVVPAAGACWQQTVSLRVEDHPEPLVELRRLLDLHGAYSRASQADALAAAGRHDEASQLYREASRLAPDNEELRFWAGLGAVRAGEMELGLRDVEAAIGARPRWRALLERLPAEIAPGAPLVLRELERRGGTGL